jgi:hypothetical protein
MYVTYLLAFGDMLVGHTLRRFEVGLWVWKT